MLRLDVSDIDGFDDIKGEFIRLGTSFLDLEHSLISISKWESKWNKAFLGKEAKTDDEIIDYIRCMTISKNVDNRVYDLLKKHHVLQITEYINAPMTATKFNDSRKQAGKSEVMTSELIYYYMISLQIPAEFQKWHLSRLITLIRVFDIKNNPGKKMSKSEVLRRNKELNAARRRSFSTSG